eukprot:13323110-Alexandrium_andersonii.AAC.1
MCIRDRDWGWPAASSFLASLAGFGEPRARERQCERSEDPLLGQWRRKRLAVRQGVLLLTAD